MLSDIKPEPRAWSATLAVATAVNAQLVSDRTNARLLARPGFTR